MVKMDRLLCDRVDASEHKQSAVARDFRGLSERLLVISGGGPGDGSISVAVDDSEMIVIDELLRYSLPRLVGWDQAF